MKLSEVKPYEKNAKKHPESQLKKIAASLRKFGWQQPIKLGKGKVIIAGHGRLAAYKKYPDDIKMPWIIDEKGKTICGEPESRKLTVEEEKAYRLADNKLNESDWDMELVVEDLKDLSGDMFELTGFDQEDIEARMEADEINELSRARDVDLGKYNVLTVEAPEAPRLKARMSFYCDDIEDFNLLVEHFNLSGGKLDTKKLLKMVTE